MTEDESSAAGAKSKRASEFKLEFADVLKRNFKNSPRKASAPTLRSGYSPSGRMSSNRDMESGNDLVDPIYMALKMANEMAQRRRSVVKVQQVSNSARAATGSSTVDNFFEDHTVDISQSRESIYSRKQSNCHISMTLSSVTSSSRSSPAPSLLAEVKSSPNLSSQKSTDSTESDQRISQRHIRKLRMHMKSFSLDCESSSVDPMSARQQERSGAFSMLKGGRCFKVRPLSSNSRLVVELSEDDSAIESDAYAPTENHKALNKPTAQGHLVCIVTHEFRAKFSEELDLKKGERVIVVNRADPDWWQGYKQNESSGRFPSTCVAKVLPSERIMQVFGFYLTTCQVIRNFPFWVVFAEKEEDDGLVAIRTENNRRINCPVNYLLPIS